METSKNSTRQLTLDELISSQEDSPANPTAPQENEKERKTTATCGRRCLELFESVHPVGSWERTFAGLLIGTGGWFSRRCALTWKLTGTPYNRLYFQLVPSTLPTDANEYGLLPTVTTHQQNTKFKQGGTCLQAHFNNLLPTPMAQESDKITGKENQDSLTKRTRLQTGKTSQLNPHFVEEMMGFPKNWIVLAFQNGEENQSKHTETQ